MEPFVASGISGPQTSGVLRVPAPGGDSRRNWKTIQQLAGAVNATRAGMARDMAKARARQVIPRQSGWMHPWKIYQFPSFMRATPAPTTDWLLWRVRGGWCAGADVTTGTDGSLTPYDDYMDVAGTDITLTAGVAKHWFWLDLSGSAPEVKHSSTPTTAGWDSAPVPDDFHIPIGWVDTLTNEAAKVAIPRQLLTVDVLLVQGCPYG